MDEVTHLHGDIDFYPSGNIIVTSTEPIRCQSLVRCQLDGIMEYLRVTDILAQYGNVWNITAEIEDN